ncbi:MAG: energy transducer TonB [Sphingobacteriales bacterium]|nr:energy transducer TonB [Sphingobacteriales bacterium]
MANQNTFKEGETDSGIVVKKDRSLLYMSIALGLIVMVMGYLTFYVDDISTLFSGKDETIALNGNQEEALLNKNSEMSDEKVKSSLIKFVDAFYRDQRDGYFDPPSYFASITETYYNFHNLTYDRLKQIHKRRLQDMQHLDLNWIVSSLDFVRNDEQLIVTYWTQVKYFKTFSSTEESADVKNEIIIDKEGKIVSFREVDTKNLTSFYVDRSADTLGGEDTGYDGPLVPPSTTATSPTSSPTTLESDSKIYDLGTVETSPEFSGGQKALGNFIASNLKYPVKATEDKVTGKVFISFIVEKNGSLTDLKIIKGIGSGCDEEAIKVLKASPPWKPGSVGGHPVRASFTLPITFQVIDQ